MIRQLAFEASSRGQKIAELAKDLVEAVARKDLFEKVLADTRGEHAVGREELRPRRLNTEAEPLGDSVERPLPLMPKSPL
jgi:hypothetical protein